MISQDLEEAWARVVRACSPLDNERWEERARPAIVGLAETVLEFCDGSDTDFKFERLKRQVRALGQPPSEMEDGS